MFFNAGVDPHEKDRLGRLALTEYGLMARERLVFETCLRRGVPVAGVLGGGDAPNLDQLARLHSIPIPDRLSGARRTSLPMHIYEATSGKPVAVILRPGKTPGGAEVALVLRHVVKASYRPRPRRG